VFQEFTPVGSGFVIPLAALALLTAPLTGQDSHPHADGSGTLTLALAGDAIITRKLSVYEEPQFLELRELVRGATAAFVNLEMLFHDFGPDIIPAATSGGTYMQADPAIAEELVWMGFDMVSMANNHTGDYGVGGMRSTTRTVEEVGLTHAGTGENMAEARSPGYLETPGGRIALISVASTFPEGSQAGHQRKDMRGRPGLSPVRFNRTYEVTSGQMEALRTFREGMGSSRGGGDRLRIFGETFVLGDAYRSVTTPNQDDLEEILASVGEAKRQADFVVFSCHSHESGRTNNYPADFIEILAHAVIDAGADVFLAHGPHVLRGIEIYEGKPIFYSLGDFLFQNETVPRQPYDNYENYGLGPEAVAPDFFDARQRSGGFPSREQVWESFVATVRFKDGLLAGVELHPITMGFGLPRPQRGRPLLASGELAQKIIEETAEYSVPFGTEISFENGVGVVRIR
jgi:poly-gamma-glutamate capsule biosynthesis protein CapA/YwtB (metallophosphatase superfamily)